MRAAERAFRRDEVPLSAPPHIHCHQLRLLRGVLGLGGRPAPRHAPFHSLGEHLSTGVILMAETLLLYRNQVLHVMLLT